MITVFICQKHEALVKDMDSKGLLHHSSKNIVNECYVQHGISSQTRCKGIATGWRVDMEVLDFHEMNYSPLAARDYDFKKAYAAQAYDA